MEFHQKLPRNKKEFLLFMGVISVLSVNMIAPLITCFEVGFHWRTWADTLHVIPYLWLAIIALVLLTARPAEWMTAQIVKHDDSFGAQITIHILCTVLLMSMFLTVIGTWIGSHHVSTDAIRLFFYKWPRNFSISFFVEACIAQPIARSIMKNLHGYQDMRAERTAR